VENEDGISRRRVAAIFRQTLVSLEGSKKSWTPTDRWGLKIEKVVATHRSMGIEDAISFHRVAAIFMPRLVALEDPHA
jgi:hypothetical protein